MQLLQVEHSQPPLQMIGVRGCFDGFVPGIDFARFRVESVIFEAIVRFVTRETVGVDCVCANKGVFLVKTKNAFVPVERDNSVNTYSSI